MSHEMLDHHFSGPAVVEEVDKTYLTWHKYHKVHHPQSEMITMLGIYKRPPNYFHLQVKDKSSDVLLNEISRFIEPGTRITYNAMVSYKRVPEYGYEHSVVVHDRKFINSEDTSVHTQKVEVHSRWTKVIVKSYKGRCPMNSNCAEYTYQWHLLFNFIFSTWSSAAVTSLYLGLLSLQFVLLKVRVEWHSFPEQNNCELTVSLVITDTPANTLTLTQASMTVW